METIQQHIVEVNKNERVNALKEAEPFRKEFDFTDSMLKSSLDEGRKLKKR